MRLGQGADQLLASRRLPAVTELTSALALLNPIYASLTRHLCTACPTALPDDGIFTQIGVCLPQMAKGDPFFAVCARGDLNARHPEARGCYDSKVTNYEMALRLEAEVINGPTTSVRPLLFPNTVCLAAGWSLLLLPARAADDARFTATL